MHVLNIEQNKDLNEYIWYDLKKKKQKPKEIVEFLSSLVLGGAIVSCCPLMGGLNFRHRSLNSVFIIHRFYIY